MKYISLTLMRGPMQKRAKESSSDVGISPGIIKARPPSKKHMSQRWLDFDSSKENHIYLSYKK